MKYSSDFNKQIIEIPQQWYEKIERYMLSNKFFMCYEFPTAPTILSSNLHDFGTKIHSLQKKKKKNSARIPLFAIMHTTKAEVICHNIKV